MRFVVRLRVAFSRPPACPADPNIVSTRSGGTLLPLGFPSDADFLLMGHFLTAGMRVTAKLWGGHLLLLAPTASWSRLRLGCPPRWIDTIQGAELWVQMALSSVACPEAIYTDCKTVQLGVRQSTQWSRSSKRRYARVWSVVAVGLDDGASADIVCWIPAHLSRDRINEARCSDGTLVSADMWAANQVADLLAKEAAESARHPLVTLEQLKDRTAQLKELAIFVGRLTYAANNHSLPDGRVGRDSTGDGRLKPKARKRKQPLRSAVVPVAKDSVLPPSRTRDLSWSFGSRVRGDSVPLRHQSARTKLRAAQEGADSRSEDAFQKWWRESRDQRLGEARLPSRSAADRLADFKARLALKRSASSPNV